ncbi:hypothetical protein [Streptomyces sp. NPDC050738]|uniref:hypothetical protein n=1 Tax=Streptomyces sp. NPDC050738 TaxID=3154744 RepID=UPI0034235BA7
MLRVVLLLAAAALSRKIVLHLGAAVARRIDAAAWVMWPLVVVWCVVAYRIGHPDWQPKDKSGAAEEGSAEPSEAAAPSDAEPVLPVVSVGPYLPNIQDLRESVARVGTPHAHISVLAVDLGTTAERVREALSRWGVPVEPVRMRGGGSSTGVKGDHPALLVAANRVVAAGQPTNNNSNNSTEVEHGEGLSIIRDRSHGHRWHVIPRPLPEDPPAR